MSNAELDRVSGPVDSFKQERVPTNCVRIERQHRRLQKIRSSSKVGVADRGTSGAAPLVVVSRPYEHWSWRLWGLWATRRVVQGPVGKLALELVHWTGSLHSPSEGGRRPGTAHALHRMEPASRKRKRRRSAAPAFDEEPDLSGGTTPCFRHSNVSPQLHGSLAVTVSRFSLA